ncbi:hypothetical protein RB596_004975 [Gaeumannomyces avenae]
MGGFLSSGQPARNPTDDVFPVYELDSYNEVARMVAWTMLRFDEVLDPLMLRDSLARLATIGDWRKLGSRVRKNAAGKLEYHIPKQFTEERPAISFTHQAHSVRADDHELGRKLPRATPGKASVQAGSDYTRSGAPLLWLHVVTFADATLVTLGWPHMAMDGVALSQVLQAWAIVLAGGDEFVPPMLSLRHDIMGTLTARDGPAAEIPKEEFFTQKLKGCTPVAFLMPRNRSSYLMRKIQMFTIGRGKGGAWVQGSLHRDVWKAVEEELAEIERR